MADQRPEGERQAGATATAVSAEAGGTAKSEPNGGERTKPLSRGALIASAVVILIVGLVVGLAAGYKIEQHRTKNDVKKLKDQLRAKPAASAASPPAAAAATSIRVTGRIKSTGKGTISLTGGNAPGQLLTNAKTVLVKASTGTTSDISAGDHVVWKPKAGQLTQADEIIVLPADAKIGSSVVSVTPSSMELKSASGNVTVSTTGATIEKVATATLTDVTAGEKVVAQARHAGSSNTATEIILLPTSSKFVA